MESKENVHEDHISVPNPTTYYPDFSRKLVCVQYPAIVNNVERSLTTLGGMSGLETVNCVIFFIVFSTTHLLGCRVYFKKARITLSPKKYIQQTLHC